MFGRLDVSALKSVSVTGVMVFLQYPGFKVTKKDCDVKFLKKIFRNTVTVLILKRSFLFDQNHNKTKTAGMFNELTGGIQRVKRVNPILGKQRG